MKGYTERRIGSSKTAMHQVVEKFKKSGTYADAKQSGRIQKNFQILEFR